jgi:hypothetical protein
MARNPRQFSNPQSNSEGERQSGHAGERGNTADLEVRIRQRAYELWEQGGRREGTADEDWRLAEEEILGITGGG